MDVHCRFVLAKFDVRTKLGKTDYGIPAGPVKLWGTTDFNTWGENRGETQATTEELKSLLGVVVWASRCRSRSGPDRTDYLKGLWERVVLVDPRLVQELQIENYNEVVINSLVTNLSSATLALVYFSIRGEAPMVYPDSFQFGVLAIQGIFNSLLSHWLRVGQLFTVGPSIVAATVPFRRSGNCGQKFSSKLLTWETMDHKIKSPQLEPHRRYISMEAQQTRSSSRPNVRYCCILLLSPYKFMFVGI